MSLDNRLTKVVSIVEERGFLSVKELSQMFDVSEVTIRRDLQRLHDEQRLHRTFGGATPIIPTQTQVTAPAEKETKIGSGTLENFLIEQIDVLVSISLSPRSDMLLRERSEKHNVAIVAESLAIEGAKTMVAIDNYQASYELGSWAGAFVQQNFAGKTHLLDLTYHLRNTQARSRGFIAGLQEELSDSIVTLSLNTQANWQSAYRLTSDAIQVNPDINLIFAINDSVASGAIQACRDLGVSARDIVVVTFGLEGDTLKNELLQCEYLKAGLAMFPEIVGPTCIETAIAAYSNSPLPEHIITPHAVLTADNISDYYQKQNGNWHLTSGLVELPVPSSIAEENGSKRKLPKKIGLLVPFREHEWYKNLAAAMQKHGGQLGIELIVADAAQNLRDEMVLRKLGIAQKAKELINPGDVILVDGGQVTTYLAEALVGQEDITVITNSMMVFDALSDQTGISLILTGGLLRHESQTLTGPTAEAVFRELRVDKLFLPVTGVSLDFGLSHTNLAEVTIKQAMIRSAREVILLADHTKFEQESVIQIAPITAVDKLITDNALPASTRLDLTKKGIEIILAQT